MNYHALFPISLLLVSQILSALCQDPQPEWDYLIFTQRWPLTACSQWQEENKNNICALPDPQDLWTIHGIWPTKSGTKGPENCNKTWHFNETQIDPIKAQLEHYWINVEKNTPLDSFWSHEWTKHGTCAAVLPQLDNELNYFNQGLRWIKQYNMKNVLTGKKITPNEKGYPVELIFDSVKAVLGKSAIIQCVVDRRTKLSLISEIRICFDKSLQLVDCDVVKGDDYMVFGDVLTNCNVKKLVVYPSKLAPFTTSRTVLPTKKTPINAVPDLSMIPPEMITSILTLESLYNTREHLITLYRTVKLLIWATI